MGAKVEKVAKSDFQNLKVSRLQGLQKLQNPTFSLRPCVDVGGVGGGAVAEYLKNG